MPRSSPALFAYESVLSQLLRRREQGPVFFEEENAFACVFEPLWERLTPEERARVEGLRGGTGRDERDSVNPLEQVTLAVGGLTLAGFSRAALTTYLQVPELDVGFDMGECPLSSLGLRHIFLTHAHGDHARCLPRHWHLRRMFGSPPATYFMPEVIREACLALNLADHRFEGGAAPGEELVPSIVGLSASETTLQLPHRKDLRVRAFDVRHRVPSLGYTILANRRKLKREFAHLSGPEIAALRLGGTAIHTEEDVPLLTFIGDCDGPTLLEQAHIWKSPVLVLEATFLEPGEEGLATARQHTHIAEIVTALEELGDSSAVEHLVLKHFSLRYARARILERVREAIPERFRERVRLLL